MHVAAAMVIHDHSMGWSIGGSIGAVVGRCGGSGQQSAARKHTKGSYLRCQLAFICIADTNRRMECGLRLNEIGGRG